MAWSTKTRRISGLAQVCKEWEVAKHLLASTVYKRIKAGGKGRTKVYETIGADYTNAKAAWIKKWIIETEMNALFVSLDVLREDGIEIAQNKVLAKRERKRKVPEQT